MDNSNNVFDNEKIQKQIMDINFKREAKFKALQTATGLGLLARDVVTEADKIYQWLIKEA
jgi:hypothetical protein